MIRGFRTLSVLPSCEEIPSESLPVSDNISSPKSDMPARASSLYLKELLSILQTVSSCSRYTTFPLFGSRFHRQNFYTPTLSAIYALLAISDRVSLNADVSENTFRFVSQSMNNFSGLGCVDWECPSLSPHVLLVLSKL